jgi:pimeloyl-ACP methyl ester carboxylesterase
MPIAAPVLLIPGLMCDARLFQHQISHLSRNRAVHVVLPIHGNTIEEMSQAVLETAPTRFAIVGFGLGAQVALDVIRRDMARVSKLVLISADPLGETPKASAARDKRMILALTGRLVQAMAEEIPAAAVADPVARDAALDLIEDMALALGPEVYVRQCRALQRRRDQQKTLLRITIPALILAGALDPLVAVRRQSFMADLMASARVQVIEGAGHVVPIEKPQALSQALELFLAGPLVLR